MFCPHVYLCTTWVPDALGCPGTEANMWVLGIKLIGSSERAASGLAIFPAPCDIFLKYTSIIQRTMYLFADVRIKWVYDNSHY